jgi:hypothetical protein
MDKQIAAAALTPDVNFVHFAEVQLATFSIDLLRRTAGCCDVQPQQALSIAKR